MTRVQIAYLHREDVSHSFHHSMLNLCSSSPNLMPNTISAFGTTLGLVEARNGLMQYFLDQTDATHIWWIDSDMGFAPTIVSQLLETNLDVVGGLTYGMGKVRPDELGGYTTAPYIVAYDLVQARDGLVHYTLRDLDVTSKKPQQVAATGTGCLLVSRSAAEKVRSEFADAWFDQVAYANLKPVMRISEDLSFCYRLAAVGISVHVLASAKTSHQKTVWLTENYTHELDAYNQKENNEQQ